MSTTQHAARLRARLKCGLDIRRAQEPRHHLALATGGRCLLERWRQRAGHDAGHVMVELEAPALSPHVVHAWFRLYLLPPAVQLYNVQLYNVQLYMFNCVMFCRIDHNVLSYIKL